MSFSRYPALPCLLCGLLIVSACSAVSPKSVLDPPHRAGRGERPRWVHSEFETRISSIRRIGILPPSVEAHLIVNGVSEKMYEWIEIGKKGAEQELNSHIERRKERFRMVLPDRSHAEEYEEILSLYAAIASSIMQHTKKDRDLFYEKFRTFNYSVGSVAAVLDRHGVDALLITTVNGVIVKRSLQMSVKGGIVSVALVDRAGVLLCYSDTRDDFAFMDMRSAESIRRAVQYALYKLPGDAL